MNSNENDIDKVVYRTYNPFSQLAKVEEIWSLMLKKCPHSYFLSWAWTELWIKSLPDDCNLSLVAGFLDKSPIIAFFLGAKKRTKYGVFTFNQLSLNQTLISYIDAATNIEYNSILVDPEITISLESLLERLPAKSWEEFRLIRCFSGFQPNLIIKSDLSKRYTLKIEKLASYNVNLDKVRGNNNDYLSILSNNKRSQILRSIKEYEKMGEIKLYIAETVEEALEIYDEYLDLHKKRWTDRGYHTAMISPYAIDFHKQLISKRFDQGEIQLVKISAGNYTIGCIYNLVYKKNVLFISSGFNYLPDNIYRPGLVCHYYLVAHNVLNGLSSYDFLEGQASYKESLSTNKIEMENIWIRKRSFYLFLENILLKLDRLKKLLFPAKKQIDKTSSYQHFEI